jgi:hypothetical protein
MAAGQGFKTFTTGEVLTAGDVNGYLMQGVLVFASAAARNAAITSPQEGQFAFTKDTNGLWYYDGAAWVASGATGDIEGVTAGVGITGGGTSGTVTITNDMATTITASGDIVVGTGSGTYDNLPIGTTAQVLTADTTVSPYKVKWATPSSGAMALITRSSFSNVASVTYDSVFSSTYGSYLVVIENIYCATTSDDLCIQLRYSGTTETGSGYTNATIVSVNSGSTLSVQNTGTTQWIATTSLGQSNESTRGHLFFYGVGTTSEPCGVNGQLSNANSSSYFTFGAANYTSRTYQGFLLKSSGANITGTVAVYGMVKA